MAGPLIPVYIGGQVISMVPATAMTLLRSGAARALPGMRTVGSQSAGPNPTGPFFGTGGANLPSLLERPGLLGRGVAGLGAAGMVASGGQSPEGERPAAPEGRVPIPEGLIRQLNERGADGLRVRPLLARAPAARDVGNTRPIREGEVDPSLFQWGDRPRPVHTAYENEPGYYGAAGRRLSGAMLAAEPEPGYNYENAPPPPRRPFAVGAPMPSRRPEAPAAESILRRIFSGQDYQSNNRPVVENKRVNWGDSENAADFFRADRAARELGTLPPVERASGGQVGHGGQGKPHKDAALVKALEIIERLMMNGR